MIGTICNKKRLGSILLMYLLSLPITYITILALSATGFEKLLVNGERYGHITLVWLFVFASIVITFLITKSKYASLASKYTLFLWIYLLASFSPIRELGNLPWINLADIIFSWQIMFALLAVFWGFILLEIGKKLSAYNACKMNKIFSKKYLPPLIIFILGFCAYSLLAIKNHNGFSTPGWDVGIFDQAIWHLSNFQVPASTVRGVSNLWADHFHPIIVLIAPIFWIFDSSLALLIFQNIVVAIGGVFVYLITKKKTDNNLLSFGLAVTYLFFGGVQHAINFGFHPEILTVGFVPMMFYGILNKNKALTYIALILALGCKEDVGLSLLAVGVVFAVFTQYKKTGLIIALVSLVWTFASLKLVIPYFTGNSNYQYWSYDTIGTTPLDFAKNFITNPLYAIKIIFNSNPEKFNSFLHVFGDFAFLPIFSPFALTLVPYLFENYLSSRPPLWVYGFHYPALFAPYLFIATLYSLFWIKNKIKRKISNPYSVIGLSLIVLVFISSSVGNYPINSFINNFSWQNLKINQENEKILRLIPKNASVSAQDSIVTHLSHRDAIYQYPDNPGADYVVLSPTYSPYPFTREENKKRIANLRHDGDYEVVSENRDIVVFKKAN